MYKIARSYATLALSRAAYRGTDISSAIPALSIALSDPDKQVRRNATIALKAAANNPENVELITKELLEFMESDWYQQQAANNSQEYLVTVAVLDMIMQQLREAA